MMHISHREKALWFLFVIAGMFACVGSLSAWTGPSTTPPGLNVDAPINVGGDDQVKNGGLSVTGLSVYPNWSPAQALSINGNQIWKSVTAGNTNLYLQYSCEGCGTIIGDNVGAENNLTIYGNVYAKGYFHNSDARLKTSIVTSPGLSVIGRLRGVSFDWKKDGIPSAGVIAQEVERAMPSAVRTDPETGLKSVEYDQLIAPLIEAIKEQQAEIDSLTHEVELLKTSR